MRQKTIDLNKYEKTADEHDWHLKIILSDVDGVPQAPLYFKSIDIPDEVSDIDSAVWMSGVRISKEGTKEEYNKRIDWYFDNASPEFQEEMVNTFGHIIDVPDNVKRAKMWLKTCPKRKRKVLVDRFLYGWMNTECSKPHNRIKWDK